MVYVLSEKQKKELIKLIGECEDCGSKENLQLHRINRGYQGGKYTLRNVKVLCARCHRLYHYNESGIRNK